MFMVNGRADRFQAVVAIDTSSGDDAKGRFRVYNEDLFANKVLWDSRDMTAASPAKEIDYCLSAPLYKQNSFHAMTNITIVKYPICNVVGQRYSKPGFYHGLGHWNRNLPNFITAAWDDRSNIFLY